ncbi:hypothetical protein BASA84_000671 [Batrachochytrium salamandrivorans]|nr:hypothetical protein BASA84_000671 [Batrachochytrium salamandrivorans]
MHRSANTNIDHGSVSVDHFYSLDPSADQYASGLAHVYVAHSLPSDGDIRASFCLRIEPAFSNSTSDHACSSIASPMPTSSESLPTILAHVHVHDSVLVACQYNGTSLLTPIARRPVFGHIMSACALRTGSCKPILTKKSPFASRTPNHASIIENRYSIKKSDSLLTRSVKSDMIVCTSDSGMLSIVALVQCPSPQKGNRVPIDDRFADSPSIYMFESVLQHRIAPPGSSYIALGHIVASDALASCIAVAAFQNNITLFPIKAYSPERCVPVFGSSLEILLPRSNATILHMAFLNMPLDFPHLLNLVVVILNKREVEVVLYEWNQLNGVISSFTQYDPCVITKESVPLHLIPLPKLPMYFLVATESEILILNSIDMKHTSRRPLRQTVPGPFHSKEIRQDLNALISAIHVLETTDTDNEHLYMTSDKGHIMYMRVTRAQLNTYIVHVGGVRRPVAFMEILSSTVDNHTLALFGSFCDGEIIHIDAKTLNVSKSEVVPIQWNSGPTLDFCLNLMPTKDTDTLYMTSGTSPYGSVKEIRHGVGVSIESSSTQFSDAIHLWSLSLSPDDECDTFLVASFAASTRIMYICDDGFVDVSDAFGFLIDTPTLNAAACSTRGFFVQVHSLGLVVVRPETMTTHTMSASTVHEWVHPNGHRIVLSAFYREYVVVSTAGESALTLLKIAIDNNSNDPRPGVCVVGTYSASLFILSLDYTEGKLTMLSELKLANYSSAAINIPHTVHILGPTLGLDAQVTETHLLVGVRDGSLIDFTLSWDNDVFEASTPTIMQLGTTPLSLVPSRRRVLGQSYVLAVSSKTWQLSISPIGGIRAALLLCYPIEHAASFLYDGSKINGFLFLTANEMSIAFVEDGPRYHTRSIEIGDTPRRILIDPVTQLLLLAVVAPTEDGKTISAINVLDPETGHVLTSERLAVDETIHSLMVWHVKPTKRYICVGTRVNATCGRVLVFGLKRTSKSRFVKFNLMGQCTLSGPVIALCSFINSYLLASAGSVLHQLKIEAVHRTLTASANIDSYSSITRIHTLGAYIYVSNVRESVSVYSFDVVAKSFKLLKSDVECRAGFDGIPLNDSLVIGSDLNGNIYGLATGSDTNRDHGQHFSNQSMRLVFGFHIGEVVLHLNMGSLSHRILHIMRDANINVGTSAQDCPKSSYKRITETSDLDRGWWPNSNSPHHGISKNLSFTRGSDAGVVYKEPILHQRARGGQILYGATLSGGLVSILRLRPEVHTTLQLLQMCMSEHADTMPLLGNNHSWFRSKSISMQNAIDGLFVTQFLTQNGFAQREIMHQFNILRVKEPYATENNDLMNTQMTVVKMSAILYWLKAACI